MATKEALKHEEVAANTADDGEADFARGFAKANGDEPPADVKPEAITATADASSATQMPAPVEVPQDPNADLTAKVIAGVMEQLAPKINALDGRLGGMKRDLTTALATAKASAAATGLETPSDKQIAAAAADPEKWKALKQDFPEFAEGVAEFVAAQVATTRQPQQTVDTEALRSQVVQELTPAFEQKLGQATKEARAYARIDTAVGEGWEDTLKSQDFSGWFDKLPTDKQRQYDTDRPADVIACLKEFGTHQTAVQTRQKKTDRLSAAVQVESTGTAGPPVLTDQDAFERGVNRTLKRVM